MRYGLAANADFTRALASARSVGVHTMRVEFPVNASPQSYDATFDQAARAGVRILPLLGFDQAPTQTTAGQWAARFGPGGTFWANRADAAWAPDLFEWGNENGYSYAPKPGPTGGGAYARSFKMAYDQIQAANPKVGLLAQAEDAGTGTSTWVDGMYAAVPGLHAYVAGWVIHPYGPGGKAKLDRMIAQTAAHGAPATVPIAITEDGISSDNGRTLSNNYGYATNMTYQQAADTFLAKVRDFKATYGSRLALYLNYSTYDLAAGGASADREAYFGAVRSDGTDKGPWTAALRTLVSENN